ncbi:hypothetical protein EDD15DRAFT_2181179 [Pisolithus albus]|nr:hypothetical protein EDD15DRAFT_2181179 [Pisolithus albus]
MATNPKNRPNRVANLCLACSSSLPPKAQDVFITRCCARPICPACLSSNPRLGRYNPCLSCLGGTAVVSASSSSRRLSHSLAASEKNAINVDGALRDNDMFVLGDDDEEENHNAEHKPPGDTGTPNIKTSPSHLTPHEPIIDYTSSSQIPTGPGPPSEQTSSSYEAVPPLYHLKRGDTLQGIALRLNLNGHELCRLNNLPMSTLTTTPHLLHTRTSIRLPPGTRLQHSSAPISVDPEAQDRAARERAEKRLQVVAGEADWRVAKAYVALADDPEADVLFDAKCKELGTDVNGSGLEARALDMYLEDEEWEKEQRKVGVGPTSYRKACE